MAANLLEPPLALSQNGYGHLTGLLPELVVGLSFPRPLASYQSLSCFFVAMTLPELVVRLSFPRPLAGYNLFVLTAMRSAWNQGAQTEA